MSKENTQLHSIIHAAIEVSENLAGHKLASENERQWLTTVLCSDLTDKIQKFIAGSKEHGGEFLLNNERNNLLEMRDEITDLFFYLAKQQTISNSSAKEELNSKPMRGENMK